MKHVTTHAAPPHGSAFTPCCGRVPTELPIGDRLALDRSKVTCRPK